MRNEADLKPTRRGAMALLTAAPVLASLPISAAQGATAASSWDGHRWTSSFLDLDPIDHFRQAMRLQRSLKDEDDILHWYHFIMVAVPAKGVPRSVVRWEGIELSRHRKLRENVYRLHGHNLSFARDLETGRFVDEVINPLTNEKVSVPTMALVSDPGMISTPAGIFPLDGRTKTFRPKYGMIRREGNIVKIDGIRVPPDSWPATFLEMGFEAAPAEMFDDPSHLWLPTDVSGAYVFPWPEWMKMGNAPGHMFAAWSGYKLRSVNELPPEFYSRAKADYPNLLNVDPAQFDRAAEYPDYRG